MYLNATKIGHRRAYGPVTSLTRTVVLAVVLGMALVIADTVKPGLPVAHAEATVLSDTFQRTVTTGWSGTGYSYTATSGATRLAVSPGRGVMRFNPGSTTQATASGITVADVSAKMSVSLSGLPTSGGGAYVGPMVRVGQTGAYRLSARVAAAGRITLAIERVGPSSAVTVLRSALVSPSVVAGQSVSLRLQASGTTSVALVGQIFLGSSSTATSTLNYTDTDAARISSAGSVAVWTYLSKSSSVASATVSELVINNTSSTSAPQPLPSVPVSTSAGSAAIGSTRYSIPSNAVFVSPSGSDSANGRLSSPFRTVTKAVNSSPSGTTVVLRGGTYHESVMVPKEKTLTLQSYPTEAVWFDGTAETSGFVKSGSTWVKTGWNYIFDASPSFSRGSADGTGAWQFINPEHPMAAHPDQIWINGVKQKQVANAAAVTSGTFYVDRAAKTLRVGTDPTGKSVKASQLQIALTVLSKNSTIRGIGFRRYAPSVPDMGAVRLFGADGSSLENVVVTESSTTGLNVGLATSSSPVKLTRVTVSDNGMLGIGSNRANGLAADRLLVSGNNSELFNGAPSAAGFKITRGVNVTVTNSVFRNNLASGLWFDESSMGVTVTRNDLSGNARHGLVFELSTRGKLVNNAIWDNANTGLLILDSSNVQAWNNSIRGSLLPVRIADGPRKNPDTGSESTWVMKDVALKNNTIGAPVAGDNWCGIVCMVDDRRLLTAAQMNFSADGNLYYRATSGVPRMTMRWAGGTAGPRDFSSLSAFKQATGQESRGAETLGTSLVDDRGVLRSGGTLSGAGVAVPSDIAAAGGLQSGSTTIGATR